jgi:hypothetical protein
MKPFALLVEYEVIEFVEGLPPAVQYAFHQRMRFLREYPYACSRDRITGQDGRVLDVCLLGDWLIKYWIDGADRQVKVLYIERAQVQG